MSPQDERQELLRNAIAFLSDPKTQASPLPKRIEFLESKGLTAAEIEDAMRQASGSSTTSAPPASVAVSQPASRYAPSYTPSTYTVLTQSPPLPQRDWRDYFIMAVVSGGVMFGVISLARKYLFPHLKPPSSTAYEADKDALAAQFDAAEAFLKEIQNETQTIKTATEDQHAKITQATLEVEAAAREMRENENRAKDEIREIRQEVDTIQEMLPKMLEKNKEAQAQGLSELQQELKSLKTLLLSRGPALSGTSTPPNAPSLSARPSIPAWQLAASGVEAGGSSAAQTSSVVTGDLKAIDAAFGGNVNGENSREIVSSTG